MISWNGRSVGRPMILLGKNRDCRQQGFTLIELLVAVGVLIVLMAVAIVGYSRFFGVADAEASAAELEDIQQAMHAMMAGNGISTVNPQPIPTNDFLALPTGAGSEFLNPNFLRVGRASGFTKCWYAWDVHGVVKQADCASGGRADKPDGDNGDNGGNEGGEDDGADLVSLQGLRKQWEEIKSDGLGDGSLNPGQTILFDSKLQEAQTALDEGDTLAAMHSLRTFINHVNAFVNSGTLSPEQGQELIQAGSQAIILLGNQS